MGTTYTVHVENGDTGLVLPRISQIEILLEASNTSASCILTLVPLSLVLVATEFFFTNIGSILKGNWKKKTKTEDR